MACLCVYQGQIIPNLDFPDRFLYSPRDGNNQSRLVNGLESSQRFLCPRSAGCRPDAQRLPSGAPLAGLLDRNEVDHRSTCLESTQFGAAPAASPARRCWAHRGCLYGIVKIKNRVHSANKVAQTYFTFADVSLFMTYSCNLSKKTLREFGVIRSN